MSYRFEPAEPHQHQDPEADRERRLAALHALAEEALQSPPVVGQRGAPAQPASTSTRPPRTLPSLRGSRPRRGRRSRLWRVSLVLVFLLFVLAAGSLTFALHVLRLGAPTQTTARAAASVGALYFDPDVPWTSVQVDNRSVPIGRPGEKAPFLLPAGHHIISWQAVPFPAQQCVLTSPAEATDTCRSAFEGIIHVPGEPAAETVRLEEESNDLQQAESGALNSRVQAALDASAQAGPIYRGEPVYLGGSIVADGTYTATTRIQLDAQGYRQICQLDLLSATRDCNLVSTQCLPICSLDYGERQSLGTALPSNQWVAIAAVSMLRDYESTTGEPANPEQVFSSGTVAFDDQALLVGLRWQDGSWQVQLYFGTQLLAPSISDAEQRILVDPACSTAQAYFAEDLTATERQAYSQVRFVSGANPSAGCLIQATSTTGGEQVEYFERFGVLLALNTAAHRLHPTMPIAGTSVQQLARQLALKKTPAMAMRFPASSRQ